jgi:hypothetical protein
LAWVLLLLLIGKLVTGKVLLISELLLIVELWDLGGDLCLALEHLHLLVNRLYTLWGWHMDSLWRLSNVTSHYSSDCSLNLGTVRRAKWQLGSKCPSSYSTLKGSIGSQILTTTSV